jgi:phage/plasmid-like protein (TIGR03299 family)
LSASKVGAICQTKQFSIMSHEINFSNGKHSVMVVGEPAWHRLGTVLENPATAEEAFEAAGLNFTVEKRKIFTSDGMEVPNRFATVRTDTNVPLGVVADRYTIVQNRDALKFFDEIVERGEAIYHSAGALGRGERVWLMARLPEYIRIMGEDVAEVYVTMLLGHDAKEAVKAFIHANRIVCNNTLQVALATAKKSVSWHHCSGVIDNLKSGAEALGITNQYRKDLESIFNQLASEKVNDGYTDAFVNALFPIPTEEVLDTMKHTPVNIGYREIVKQSIESGVGQDMVTTKGTKWGLYNGVTYWLDHMRNYRGEKKDGSKKLNSIWFGAAAETRQNAFDLLQLDAPTLRLMDTVLV